MNEFILMACAAFVVFAFFVAVLAFKSRRQPDSEKSLGGCGQAQCHCRRETGSEDPVADPLAAIPAKGSSADPETAERCADCPNA